VLAVAEQGKEIVAVAQVVYLVQVADIFLQLFQ
jgi:hypothetical protein